MVDPRDDPKDERVDELAEEVREENPDPTTRRESFELDLMEKGLVDEGRDVQVNGDEPGP